MEFEDDGCLIEILILCCVVIACVVILITVFG